MIRVSILIPAFNSEKYIADAIQSAIDQTWNNIEVIVVDDGSTDKSFEIANSFVSDKVKVYKQPNSGACRARNFAFELCSGEYIQYLDADDLLSAGKIESQLTILQAEHKEWIVSCPWARFYKDPLDAKFKPLKVFKDYGDPVQLLCEMWLNREMMQTSVWLTPRTLVERIGGWNGALTINQDGEFFCRALLASSGVKFCSSAKVFYRSNVKESITSGKLSNSKAASLLASLNSYQQQVFNYSSSIKCRYALATNYYSFIYEFYHLYPNLVKKAITRVNFLDIPPVTNIGGENFKRLAAIFGFYSVLSARKILHKIFKSKLGPY